jgi:hypothetical protein
VRLLKTVPTVVMTEEQQEVAAPVAAEVEECLTLSLLQFQEILSYSQEQSFQLQIS